jgi:flagellar biogenesis protein FliO
LGGEERRNWRETRGTENGETVKETNEIGKNFLSMLKVILLIIIVYIIKK